MPMLVCGSAFAGVYGQRFVIVPDSVVIEYQIPERVPATNICPSVAGL